MEEAAYWFAVFGLFSYLSSTTHARTEMTLHTVGWTLPLKQLIRKIQALDMLRGQSEGR